MIFVLALVVAVGGFLASINMKKTGRKQEASISIIVVVVAIAVALF